VIEWRFCRILAWLLAQEPLRAGTIRHSGAAWAANEGRHFEKYGIRNLEVTQFSGDQRVSSDEYEQLGKEFNKIFKVQ
jgi:hypothetical protein